MALLQAQPDIPTDVLENLKSEAEENHVLTKSAPFVHELNALLAKHGIEGTKIGGARAQKWDDEIPF